MTSEAEFDISKWLKMAVLAFIGLLVAFLVIFNAVRFFGKVNTERDIREFVQANQAELVNIAENYLSGNTSQVEYKGVSIEGVYENQQTGETPIVQFYFSGFGIVPSSTYYGFYYSAADTPASYQNCGYELFSVTDGEWEWSDDTGNGGITKRICDCWFYYSASF